MVNPDRVSSNNTAANPWNANFVSPLNPQAAAQAAALRAAQEAAAQAEAARRAAEAARQRAIESKAAADRARELAAQANATDAQKANAVALPEKARADEAAALKAEAAANAAEKLKVYKEAQLADVKHGLTPNKPSGATTAAKIDYDVAVKSQELATKAGTGQNKALHSDELAKRKALEDAGRDVRRTIARGEKPTEAQLKRLQSADDEWRTAVRDDLRKTAIEATAQGKDPQAAIDARYQEILGGLSKGGIFKTDKLRPTLAPIRDAVKKETPEQRQLLLDFRAAQSAGEKELQQALADLEKAGKNADPALIANVNALKHRYGYVDEKHPENSIVGTLEADYSVRYARSAEDQARKNYLTLKADPKANPKEKQAAYETWQRAYDAKALEEAQAKVVQAGADVTAAQTELGFITGAAQPPPAANTSPFLSGPLLNGGASTSPFLDPIGNSSSWLDSYKAKVKRDQAQQALKDAKEQLAQLQQDNEIDITSVLQQAPQFQTDLTQASDQVRKLKAQLLVTDTPQLRAQLAGAILEEQIAQAKFDLIKPMQDLRDYQLGLPPAAAPEKLVTDVRDAVKRLGALAKGAENRPSTSAIDTLTKDTIPKDTAALAAIDKQIADYVPPHGTQLSADPTYRALLQQRDYLQHRLDLHNAQLALLKGRVDVLIAPELYAASRPVLQYVRDGKVVDVKLTGTTLDDAHAYALTHGITRDAQGNLKLTGLPPGITADQVKVKKEADGWYVTFDKSTGVFTPRAPKSGYLSPSERGKIAIKEGHRYKLNPDTAKLWEAYAADEANQAAYDKALAQVKQDPQTDPNGRPLLDALGLPSTSKPLQGPNGTTVMPVDFNVDQTKNLSTLDDALRNPLLAPDDPTLLETQRNATLAVLNWQQADLARQMHEADVRAGRATAYTSDDPFMEAVNDRKAEARTALAKWDTARRKRDLDLAQGEVTKAQTELDRWLARYPYQKPYADQSPAGLKLAVAKDNLAAVTRAWEGNVTTTAELSEKSFIEQNLKHSQLSDPHALYNLFNKDPKTMAQGVINRFHLKNGGEPIQINNDTHLKNLVAIQLGLGAPAVELGADKAENIKLMSERDLFPQLTSKERDFVNKVVEQIREDGGQQSKVTALPIVYAKNESKERGGGIRQTVLFKVESGGSTTFVDEHGRTYSSVDDFRANNMLPVEGVNLVMPKDGKFTLDADGNVELFIGDARTETGFETFRRKTHLDTIVGGLAIVGGVLLEVGSAGTLTPVAGALILGGATLFFAATSIESFHARAVHGESINPFTDGDARREWLYAAASVLPLPGVGTATRTTVGAFRAARGADVALNEIGIVARNGSMRTLQGAPVSDPSTIKVAIQGPGALTRATAAPALVTGVASMADGGYYMVDNWQNMTTAEKAEHGGMFLLNIANFGVRPAATAIRGAGGNGSAGQPRGGNQQQASPSPPPLGAGGPAALPAGSGAIDPASTIGLLSQVSGLSADGHLLPAVADEIVSRATPLAQQGSLEGLPYGEQLMKVFEDTGAVEKLTTADPESGDRFIVVKGSSKSLRAVMDGRWTATRRSTHPTFAEAVAEGQRRGRGDFWVVRADEGSKQIIPDQVQGAVYVNAQTGEPSPVPILNPARWESSIRATNVGYNADAPQPAASSQAPTGSKGGLIRNWKLATAISRVLGTGRGVHAERGEWVERPQPILANATYLLDNTKMLLNERDVQIHPDHIPTDYSSAVELNRAERITNNLRLDMNLFYEEYLQRELEHHPAFTDDAKKAVELIHDMLAFSSLDIAGAEAIHADLRQVQIENLTRSLEGSYPEGALRDFLEKNDWTERNFKDFLNSFTGEEGRPRQVADTDMKVLKQIKTQLPYFGGSIEYQQNVKASLEYYIYHISTLTRDANQQYGVGTPQGNLLPKDLRAYNTRADGEVPFNNLRNLGTGVVESPFGKLPKKLQDQIENEIGHLREVTDAEAGGRAGALRDFEKKLGLQQTEPTAQEIWDRADEDGKKRLFADILRLPWSDAHLHDGTGYEQVTSPDDLRGGQSTAHFLEVLPPPPDGRKGLVNVAGVHANVLERPEVAGRQYAEDPRFTRLEEVRQEGTLDQLFPGAVPRDQTLQQEFVEKHRNWHERAMANAKPQIGGISGHTLGYMNLYAEALNRVPESERGQYPSPERLRAIMLAGLIGTKRHHSYDEVMSASTGTGKGSIPAESYRAPTSYGDVLKSADPEIRACAVAALKKAQRGYVSERNTVLTTIAEAVTTSNANEAQAINRELTNAVKKYLKKLGNDQDSTRLSNAVAGALTRRAGH